MFLLDTNCFVYYLNNSQAEFCDWFDTLDDCEVYVSSLVLFELLIGYYIKNNKRVINIILQMAENYNLLNYDADDAILTARNKALLRAKGVQNDSLDIHIASQAINKQLTLVTFNHKDFKPIQGLKVKSFTFQQELPKKTWSFG
jgi:predicted nucleic acid-binding protein